MLEAVTIYDGGTVEVVTLGGGVEVVTLGGVVETVTLPGKKGDQGANASLLLLEIEVEEDIPGEGWPIAINRATGKGKLARADNYALSFVIGFSKSACDSGFVVELENYAIEKTDWTAIAGTQYLTPGNQYFLQKTTGIGAVDLSAVATAMVGTALSPTVLKLSIMNPTLM